MGILRPLSVPSLDVSVDDVEDILMYGTGDKYHVSTTGNDANSGENWDNALLTIDAAHTLCTADQGDVILVAEGTYDENLAAVGLDITKNEVILLGIGRVVVTNTNGAATDVILVSGDNIRVKNIAILQAGAIGLRSTGNINRFVDVITYQCTVGYSIVGNGAMLQNCHAVDYTITGFNWEGNFGQAHSCNAIAVEAAVVTGFDLSVNTADSNLFNDCHTANNGAASWNIVAGADLNTIVNCSMGQGDGGVGDAGTANTFANFSMDSQILAGQSVQDDLAAIYNRILAVFTEVDATAVYPIVAGGTEVFLDDGVAMGTAMAAITGVDRRRYFISLDISAISGDGGAAQLLVRRYKQVNGAAYQTIDTTPIALPAVDEIIDIQDWVSNQNLRISFELDAPLGGAQNLPYDIIEQDLEA